MPGNAKTNKFMLTSATVMLGPMADLHKLNVATHSVGLVKNFQVTNDPQYVELTQGTMNEVVESIRTNDAMKATAEIYEYTPKNIAYAAGLDDANAKFANSYTDFTLDANIMGVAAAASIVLTTDATATITAGDFVILQDSIQQDHLHIGLVATATFATGKTTITFAAGYEIPIGVAFSKLTTKVREVVDLQLGGDATQYYYSAKIVGIAPRDGRAVTVLFPKVKITKGFTLNFHNENFANMPFELTPYPLVPSDSTYSFYPSRRMILFTN